MREGGGGGPVWSAAGSEQGRTPARRQRWTRILALCGGRMGNGDSKLNFRKAVIQLTTKTQVGQSSEVGEKPRRRSSRLIEGGCGQGEARLWRRGREAAGRKAFRGGGWARAVCAWAGSCLRGSRWRGGGDTYYTYGKKNWARFMSGVREASCWR